MADNHPAPTTRAQDSRSGSHADNVDVRLRVEAFGSGVVLHEGLGVALNATVGVLRQLVRSSVTLSHRTRSIRLFVGHGGAELDDDATLIANTPLATNVDHKPLVAFPKLCK